MTKVIAFPAVSQRKKTPLVSKKLFDHTTLQSTINVLSTKSWLEETIDRKKRRYEDASPSKDLIAQVTSSQPPSKKMKKKKSIATLATDPSTSHMLVEITEPQKEGKFHELSSYEFQIRIVDLGIHVHDSMVNMWKSTNEKIEDRLEDLRAEKEFLKASNKDLMEYINFLLGSTSTSQFDLIAEENKNLLLKLQKVR